MGYGNDNHIRGKMTEVVASVETQDLMHYYANAWASRYGEVPVPQDNDYDVLRWLQKTLGKARSSQLITKYLKMNNAWFCENAHALSVLKKNLNLVIAAEGKRVYRQSDQKAIIFTAYCDYCPITTRTHVYITCYAEDSDTTLRQCDSCRQQGRNAFIVPTAKEREEIFAQLSIDVGKLFKKK